MLGQIIKSIDELVLITYKRLRHFLARLRTRGLNMRTIQLVVLLKAHPIELLVDFQLVEVKVRALFDAW